MTINRTQDTIRFCVTYLQCVFWLITKTPLNCKSFAELHVNLTSVNFLTSAFYKVYFICIMNQMLNIFLYVSTSFNIFLNELYCKKKWSRFDQLIILMRLLNQSVTPVFTLSGVSMNINLSIRFLKQLFLIPPPAPKKIVEKQKRI